MNKIVNSEINIIAEFFKDFTDAAVRVFSEKFDANVFDKIDFLTDSVSNLNDIDELNSNNAVYRLNYSFDTLKSSFLVLIPEEFVAIAADLFMGGDAKEIYNGSLDELEINASLNLFNKILDDIKIIFKSLYKKDLIIELEPQVIIKNISKYNKTFNDLDIDLAISHNLQLGNDKKFLITTVTNTDALKQLLTTLGVLEELFIQNINQIMPKEIDRLADISRIADIKINIFAELGRIKLSIKQLLGLVGGSIVELDTYEDSTIRVFANGLEVAKAQIVVVDEHFGIKITEIINPEERYKDT